MSRHRRGAILGVVHLDRAGRDGMVLDILEVARPAVEAHVLGLVEQRTFRRSDFEQAPNGAVRAEMAAARWARSPGTW